MMAAVAAAGPSAAAVEEDEPTVAKVQTSFALKLVKYDEAKKIALIKELKNIMEGMNLVQVCPHSSILINHALRDATNISRECCSRNFLW